MKIIKSLIFLILLLCAVEGVMAGCDTECGYEFNGNGLPEYPNKGYLWTWVSIHKVAGDPSYKTCYSVNPPSYNTAGHYTDYNITYYGKNSGGYRSMFYTSFASPWALVTYPSGIYERTGTVEIYSNSNCGISARSEVRYTSSLGGVYSHIKLMVGAPNTISGNTGCVSNVTLFLESGGVISNSLLNTGGGSYSFPDLLEGFNYTLRFSDEHEYDFQCTGSDMVYDYNACKYTTIYLKDYCGNKMSNTSVDIYKSDGGNPATYEFIDNFWNTNPISLSVDEIGEGKMLDIFFDTDMGTYHHIDYCEDKIIDILHPFKWWSISFGAFDDMTQDPIESIKMVVNQTCKACPERALITNGFTDATGYKMFTCLSAQKVNIRMDNDQYGGDRFFVSGLGDAFHTHHVLDTYLNLSNPMQDDFWNNTDNMSVGCNIKFKDASGHVDNHINDTDTYVDLYYENGNCSATLKFQRLYGTYWMTKESYNIPALETGYKRILNANFSTADAYYRGIMIATECECNATLSLYVTNETIEEEMHYENLTTYIRFNHQLGGGRVDYRSDVSVKAYAYTNTSASLLNINLTLYEQTNQIATVDLDWADFAGATPKWYYTWNPNVDYDIGKNYTVVMTGYNGLNLCADDVWTSNIRNNKLTVNVQDNHGAPLAYTTVFIQCWGSIALNSATSTEIEGFGDNSHQYKATKSGYLSSGWSTVTFNNSDESVTCILTEEKTESVTGYKLKDSEIKSFFIPLMYALLIMILIGGLLNASKD